MAAVWKSKTGRGGFTLVVARRKIFKGNWKFNLYVPTKLQTSNERNLYYLSIELIGVITGVQLQPPA